MCGNRSVAIWLPEGDGFRLRVTWGLTDEYRQIEEAVHLRPGRESIVGRVALTGQVEHIHDCLEDPDYAYKEDARDRWPAHHTWRAVGAPQRGDRRHHPLAVLRLTHLRTSRLKWSVCLPTRP